MKVENRWILHIFCSYVVNIANPENQPTGSHVVNDTVPPERHVLCCVLHAGLTRKGKRICMCQVCVIQAFNSWNLFKSIYVFNVHKQG